MPNTGSGILRTYTKGGELFANFDLFLIGAQSDCSWTKLLIGVAAFLGGLTFLLVGVIIHVRARKGNEL